MSSISTSTGLASGINYGALIDSLIAIQQRPIDNLNARLQNVQATQTGLTQLETQLVAVTGAEQALTNKATFQSLTSQVGDPTQLSVTTRTGAIAGVYSFQSVQLAATNIQVSKGFANFDQQQIGTAGQIVISNGGQLNPPTNLDLLNGGGGVRRGKIQLTDRSGASTTVDLSNAVTAQDVVDAINNAGVGIAASTSGGKFVLSDTTGKTASNLSVTDVAGGNAASDLGLSQSVASSTLTGSSVYRVTTDFTLNVLNDGNPLRTNPNGNDFKITTQSGAVISVSLKGAATIGDVVRDVNNATGNGGKVTASLSNDGRLVLTDSTTGAGTLQVNDLSSSNVIRGLGLTTTASGNVLTGKKLSAGLNSVLLSDLRGGQGISQTGQISLTDRAGNSATVDLTGAESLDDVLNAINNATTNGGAKLQLKATLNANGAGIKITDTSGASASNLVIADVGGSTLASQLKIAVNGAQTAVDSGSLGLRRVSEGTSLNGYAPKGGNVPPGAFVVSDSAGNSAIVNVNSSASTIGDVLDAINNTSGINVHAQLNQTGDGIEIVDNAGGSKTLSVSDLGGTTATALRLTGAAVTGGDGKQHVISRQAAVISVSATDTLQSLSIKVNDANGGLRSSVVNSGSTLNPYRLSFTSTNSGRAGSLVIDDGGLNFGFTTQVKGQDAVLRVGSDPATAFLKTNNTNTFNGAQTGVDVTLLAASSSLTSVTLSQDTSKISTALSNFVTAYNSFAKTANALDSFDPTTLKRSALQGTGVVQGLFDRFSTLINAQSGAAGSTVRSLADIGITLTVNGQLSFDQTKLNSALQTNATDVSNFFITAKTGFANTFKAELDHQTDQYTGALTFQINAYQTTVTDYQNRIKTLQAVLAKQKSILTEKFNNTENIISGLQGQYASLASLTGASSATSSLSSPALQSAQSSAGSSSGSATGG